MMSKQNKLKKGSGLHLDMLVVAFVTGLTSLLGMPWMVAATVRSLAHLRSLQLYETMPTKEVDGTSAAPKVEFVGVQEQRVTGLMIHALIGGSILFFRNYLRRIPVSVLTGLFLYLGVSSIDKTDFFDRMKLFIMDKRDIPQNASWFKSVSLGKTKLFTAIQASLLAAMWWIKGTSLGVFFPVLIGLLAPIRIALEKLKIFSSDELKDLDGELG
jgi:hypothetical protein